MTIRPPVEQPPCPYCASPAQYCVTDDAYHELARRLDLRPEAPSGVGPGWVPLLERLVVDLRRLGWQGRLGQIKEKFGGLRFYADGLTEAHHDRIETAMDESVRTPET